MKAYFRVDAATQEVQFSEMPVPEIGTGQVLVRVEAFGVGIHDRYFIPASPCFPYTIGSEGAGIITRLGNDVRDFAIGDRVIFSTILQPEGGAWAEYAAANQETLVPLPDNLTFAVGATVPIAGKTALECMRELDLEKGDKLFIAGASGAIGTLVIQLAKAKGIYVSASASAINHDYMKSLGAENTVDYHEVDWIDTIKEWSDGGVAAALAIQPGTGIDSIKVIKAGGKLITVSGDSDKVTPERNITIRQMGHDAGTHQKAIQLVNTIANGGIQIVIEKEYPFEQALEALEKTETRHARGKLVVKGIHN